MGDSDDPFKNAEVLFVYSDREAIDDGILVPFVTPAGRDTHHRVTSNAIHELNEHHRGAYPAYDEADFMRFYLAELLPLVPEAFRIYERTIVGGILKTDCAFKVTERSGDVLWYIPTK